MKVLSLGTDEQVFETGSAVRQRQTAYARTFGQLDLVVLTKRAHAPQQDGPLSLRAAAGDPITRLFKANDLMKKSEKPDVVTVQDPFEIGLVGWLAARHFNVPLHVQVHTDFLAPAYAQHSFINRIRVWIAGYVLRRASRIRVVSADIKRKIEMRYQPSAPITVLPIFIDIETLRRAQPSAQLLERFAAFKTKLLVVARLEPEKNVELAIRAFAHVAQNDACLIIVGEGRERTRLTALARKLGVADRVFFEGQKPASEYYSLADLVLVPSRYEGYGLVIVEALAVGKPVLATDVGIAREAGAIVSSEENFASGLANWFKNGIRQTTLKNYSYNSFAEYVHQYGDDIKKTAGE